MLTLLEAAKFELLLKKMNLLEKDPRFDPWPTKILLAELLWGKQTLPPYEPKGILTVLGFELAFRAYLSDLSTNPTTGNNFHSIVPFTDMSTETENLIHRGSNASEKSSQESTLTQQQADWLPPQSRQAAKAMFLLLFFSVLMFTLPFLAFFLTKRFVLEHYHLAPFESNAIAVFAAVLCVNVIIGVYVYIAYKEQEYDSDGSPISNSSARSKSNLEVKND